LRKRIVINLVLLLGLVSTMLFMGGCLAEGTEAAEDGGIATSIWPMIIFIVVLFGIMYFLMIRPQRSRQKEHQNLLQELNRGDRVITAGGIYGQIESVSDDNVVIKIESGSTMRVAKSSIIGKQSEPGSKIG